MPRTRAADPKTWPAILSGMLTIVLMLGALAAWSSFAPLESAAVAPGVIGVESQRKTIKHLEGGIVAAILVREGDTVRQGQELVVIDSTQAKARLDLLRGRQLALSARAARLMAEKDEQAQIDFSQSVVEDLARADVRKVIDGEIGIFQSRQDTLASQISILKQQDGQFAELIVGLEKSIQAQQKQLKVMGEEIALYQSLLDKGLTQKPRVLELIGREAEIEGRKSQNEAEIARTQQRMGENKLRIAELRTERKNEAAEELRAAQTELADLEAQILAARDVLQRTSIVAPIDGTVVGLRVFTTGGVIGSGDPLMDIVPANDRLLVDARVHPRDIDVVYPGLMANIHVSAFQKRHVQPLRGQVLSVSADRMVEERTGEAYYLARIELSGPADGGGEGMALYPGMAAEVMIITGQRTILEYLLEPITRSFNSAFRES